MAFRRRLITLCLFAFGLAIFWYGPRLLELSEAETLTWMGVPQLGGTFAAAAFCLLAAWRSEGSDRMAWTRFFVGSTLYLSGNLYYLYGAMADIPPSFPAPPEGLYFVMAVFFAMGLYQYSNVAERVGRVQLYNFILIYCAIVTACLFLMNSDIRNSAMGPFANIVAFLYPALWFSVAAFGIITLLLYNHGERTFPFALLLGAVLAEAAADLQYAQELMAGTYQLGGLIQLLWVASIGLIVAAAVDQAFQARHLVSSRTTARRRSDRGWTQAAVPAAAIAIFMLSGSISGAFGQGGFYVGFSAALALMFATVAGLREQRIIHIQQRLHGAVEDSRADLAENRRRLMSVLESTTDSVIVVDSQWRVEFFNQSASETVGASGALTLGASFWEVFPLGEGSGRGERYRSAVETQIAVEFEEFLPRKGIWLEVHACPTPDGLSIFFRDISERRRIREEITHLALHDPLTGLANRVLFRRRLEEAMALDDNVALLIIDLDHFKEVNDTLGHAVGDTLLSCVADELGKSVGAQNTIARLGGDEFAIICAGYRNRAAVLQLARQVLAAAAVPHIVDGQSVQVSASAGIALADGRGKDPDHILRDADIALYEAKGINRGECVFFEPAMETRIQRRRGLRADLVAALANDEFELAYQPIVNLRTNGICGFEALLRWRHPVQGVIAPDLFLPLAEETGLINEIGDWVLATACAEAAAWPAEISLAVNLSTRQFDRTALPDRIEAILAATGLDHRRLELEITESVLLNDSKANIKLLKRFEELGIRIALDDFGTGYSSLAYLQKFQFSKLKIDRSFVSGLPDNEESQAIVRAIIGLGKSLGMRVTAEGVETEAQYDWVSTGCDEAQGYLMSRPVPASDIPGLLLRFAAGRLMLAKLESRMAG